MSKKYSIILAAAIIGFLALAQPSLSADEPQETQPAPEGWKVDNLRDGREELRKERSEERQVRRRGVLETEFGDENAKGPENR